MVAARRRRRWRCDRNIPVHPVHGRAAIRAEHEARAAGTSRQADARGPRGGAAPPPARRALALLALVALIAGLIAGGRVGRWPFHRRRRGARRPRSGSSAKIKRARR